MSGSTKKNCEIPELYFGRMIFHPGKEVQGRIVAMHKHLGWVMVSGAGPDGWTNVSDFAGNFLYEKPPATKPF